MTRLLWNQDGQRQFETGIDRAVLFPPGRAGVPWNGLTALNEAPVESTVTAYYNDGVKYLNHVTPGEYQATLEAYNYPREFEVLNGEVELESGFHANQQQRGMFDLCYRTRVGNDQKSTDYGYKLHFLYNATASPSSAGYSAIGDSVTPTMLSWNLTTLPLVIPELAPSSHFTLNSTRVAPHVIDAVEAVIYGSAKDAPRMPMPWEIKLMYYMDHDPSNSFTEFFKADF